MSLQDRYDDAMFDFSTGAYEAAMGKLQALLAEDPTFFDAQLSLGMAFYRRGDLARAILEGHKAEQLRPQDLLAHTNLSLFYQKNGDKQKAEYHGLQARIMSWKTTDPAPDAPAADSGLELAKPPPPPVHFPDMPWKKSGKSDPNGGA
jgi:tetratricopeptide (TPR) repeat protein